MKKAVVLTADKFEDMEVYVPIFRLIEESWQVDVAAPEKQEISGENGYSLMPDKTIDQVNGFQPPLTLGLFCAKMSLLEQVNMKTIFCEFLDSQDKDGTIKVKPLGKAKNSISKPTLPGWKDIVTKIVIDKKYAKGLDGIEDYSHVIVVYWMDKEKECHLKHHPQGKSDIPFVGIFACRCPQRLNRIAISTVKLIERLGNVLTVKGLDIVSGTSVLDIKPYTPRYDRVDKAKVPKWVNKLVF